MNYLAHLYLSFGHEEIMVGNYIADAVKGRQVKSYPEGIQTGIMLHRNIDDFTDNHALVEQSKARIRDSYRKFSGVVIDMYYDHFLAVGWPAWSDVPLLQFTKKAYRTLFKHYMQMPFRMKRILPAMAIGNWLASYADVDNVGLALQGMSRRTTFDSGIENAKNQLIEHYDDLRSDFDAFFPELIAYAQAIIEKDTG